MKKVLLSLLLVTALTVAAWSQHKITGIVRGYNNEPIEAASVLVRSTNTFATTGEDGRYTLEVLQAPPFILRIQAVGFKYRDITVNEITGTPIETTLIED